MSHTRRLFKAFCLTLLTSSLCVHVTGLKALENEVYTGCGFDPVPGHPQALKFCNAYGQCIKSFCGPDHVFSKADCGCVLAHHPPPAHTQTTGNLAEPGRIGSEGSEKSIGAPADMRKKNGIGAADALTGTASPSVHVTTTRTPSTSESVADPREWTTTTTEFAPTTSTVYLTSSLSREMSSSSETPGSIKATPSASSPLPVSLSTSPTPTEAQANVKSSRSTTIVVLPQTASTEQSLSTTTTTTTATTATSSAWSSLSDLLSSKLTTTAVTVVRHTVPSFMPMETSLSTEHDQLGITTTHRYTSVSATSPATPLMASSTALPSSTAKQSTLPYPSTTTATMTKAVPSTAGTMTPNKSPSTSSTATVTPSSTNPAVTQTSTTRSATTETNYPSPSPAAVATNTSPTTPQVTSSAPAVIHSTKKRTLGSKSFTTAIFQPLTSSPTKTTSTTLPTTTTGGSRGQENIGKLSDLPCGSEVNITGITSHGALTGDGAFGAVYIGARGVVSNNGHTHFSGRSFMWIPFYEGNRFTSGLTILLEVKEDTGFQTPQGLIHNCGNDVVPSFSITLDPSLGQVTFKAVVMTTNTPYPFEENLEVSIPYTPGGVKSIELQCDGWGLSGRVDSHLAGTKTSATEHYELSTRPSPLYIGKGCRSERTDNFYGDINNIAIYRCVRGGNRQR